MKKFLVILLCLLAVFAVVSCKEEPEEDATPASGENGGTITIKPASTDWGTQTGKMQFILNYEFAGQEEISFLLKFTPEVTKFRVRAGETGSYGTWLDVTDFSALETTDDGWYIVELDGSTVTESEGLGFTAYVSEQSADIEIQIKNLKIDGALVDLSEWDEATCVKPMVGVPAALSATITK